MNYIIYDLEFNQKDSTSSTTFTSTQFKTNESNTIPFEIIQIGALKLNENFETIDTFDVLIKPTLYKDIHPFVENLTKITNEKVALCKNFIDVYRDFVNFIGTGNIILCVWGANDIKELIRNVQFYDLPRSHAIEYIDIQKYTSQYFKTPDKSKISLKNAIEFLNIPIKGEFHDAFNDAFYTAEVFKLIYNTNIKPSIYTSAPSKRISKPKEKVDTTALINQFEKIYERKLTEEEKSMIKLAYLMGKTKQFIY